MCSLDRRIPKGSQCPVTACELDLMVLLVAIPTKLLELAWIELASSGIPRNAHELTLLGMGHCPLWEAPALTLACSLLPLVGPTLGIHNGEGALGCHDTWRQCGIRQGLPLLRPLLYLPVPSIKMNDLTNEASKDLEPGKARATEHLSQTCQGLGERALVHRPKCV